MYILYIRSFGMAMRIVKIKQNFNGNLINSQRMYHGFSKEEYCMLEKKERTAADRKSVV